MSELRHNSMQAREEAAKKAGSSLLANVHSLLRAAAMHERNNRSLDRPCRGIIEALQELGRLESKTVTLNIAEGVAYINAHRLRLDPTAFSFAQNLEGLFGKWESSGLRFDVDLNEDDVKSFFYFLSRYRIKPDDKQPLQSLRADITTEGLNGISPTPRMRLTLAGEETMMPGALGLKTYAKLVSGFDRLLEQDPLPLSQAQRLVQDLSDALDREAALLGGLALSPAETVNFARRSVNTAILALSVAKNLGGVTRAELSDLGLAALVQRVAFHQHHHKVQRGELPAEVADRAWIAIDQLNSPLAGTGGGLRGIAAATESRRDRKGEGPPLSADPRPPLVTSQILRLVSDLQKVMYPKGGGRSHSYQEAVAYLLANHEPYAPELLLLLVQTTDLLPLGTVIELDDGAIGVVTEPARTADGQHAADLGGASTRVRLLFDPDQQPVIGYHVAVLGGPRGDGDVWRIRRLLDASDYPHLRIQAALENPQALVAQVKLPDRG